MTAAVDMTAPAPRTARCACAALTVTLAGAPVHVHACSCLRCQRLSGSAFSYTAFYPDSAVAAIEGPYTIWRDTARSGFWTETASCPTCGSRVFSRVEAWPDVVGIAVGCLSDPAFPPPADLCWSSRRHHWLAMPATTRLLEEQ